MNLAFMSFRSRADRNNLRKERLILAHGSRGFHHHEKVGQSSQWNHTDEVLHYMAGVLHRARVGDHTTTRVRLQPTKAHPGYGCPPAVLQLLKIPPEMASQLRNKHSEHEPVGELSNSSHSWSWSLSSSTTKSSGTSMMATRRQSKNKGNTQHSARRMEIGNLHNIPLKSVLLMTPTNPQKENIYKDLHYKHKPLPNLTHIHLAWKVQMVILYISPWQLSFVSSSFRCFKGRMTDIAYDQIFNLSHRPYVH